MDARDFINKQTLIVANWSDQASLLSYGQVAEYMEAYHQSKLAEMPSEEDALSACNKMRRLSPNYADNAQRDGFMECWRWLKSLSLTESKQEEGEEKKEHPCGECGEMTFSKNWLCDDCRLQL